ncbi:MAG TPA: hypothetical protein VF708_12460 [Pyrinomonadaceae bacterium]|jgi:hypothetical protein
MRLYRCLFISTLALAWPALTHAAQLEPFKLSILEATRSERGEGGEALINNRDHLASDATLTPRALDIAKRGRPLGFSQAYSDAFNILKEDNSCSQFFGGAMATRALDRLADQLQQKPFPDTRVGVRMDGAVTNVTDAPTGFSYRLFENATVNSNGPFFKRKRDPSEDFVPNVGSFAPNTREARVSILLHELAHLVRAPDRNWLIPDDGGNPEQSVKNTETIETNCGHQIRRLKNSRVAEKTSLK